MVHAESHRYQKLLVWKVKPSLCKRSSCTSERVWIRKEKSSAGSSRQASDHALPNDLKPVDCSYHESFSRHRTNDYFLSCILVCVVPCFRRVPGCNAWNRGKTPAASEKIVRGAASFCAHRGYRGSARS